MDNQSVLVAQVDGAISPLLKIISDYYLNHGLPVPKIVNGSKYGFTTRRKVLEVFLVKISKQEFRNITADTHQNITGQFRGYFGTTFLTIDETPTQKGEYLIIVSTPILTNETVDEWNAHNAFDIHIPVPITC